MAGAAPFFFPYRPILLWPLVLPVRFPIHWRGTSLPAARPPGVVRRMAASTPRVLVMRIERRRVSYEGRVQGVGFRMTARRLASGFPLSGFVRNLQDGRVELVAEGDPESLVSYLQAILREFGDMIRDVREVSEPVEGEKLAGFTIRY